MMEEKEKRLEKAPNSLIFVSLASMYLDNGMVDEAIDLCKSGLEIEPGNEEAHLILARAEIEKGKIEQARQRLMDIIKGNPENETAKELLKQIKAPPLPAEKREEAALPPSGEKGEEPEPERADAGTGAGVEPIEEIVLEGEKIQEPFDIESSVDEAIEEAIHTASQISGLIPSEEEVSPLDVLEEEPEEVVEREEEPPAQPIDEELLATVNEKMVNLLKMQGIISCFFRLKDGRIIKNPQLVGNVDDLVPLLDSLLGAVKDAAGKLELGYLELLMIEIDKGVFYIYSKKDYDCFLVSQSSSNFGIVKVMAPKILGDLSIGS
jgi:predicted regulator of Ras-like GTPase activity (Roadblock/LC7/MglB family)